MVDVAIRYTNPQAMWNRINSLKLGPRDCDTPSCIDGENGDMFFTTRLTAKQADKFPPNNNPAFSLVWRSDVSGPRPTYAVENTDLAGNGLGTYYQQEIGVIA